MFGVAARSAEENVAAKMALADVPLKQFLTETVTRAAPTRAAR
jgi:ethanolamine ammonia-lyase large subunit